MTVTCAYVAFTLLIVAGLVMVVRRGDWQQLRGLDKLIAFGPMFFAAPLGAFGTEHFTIAKEIASIVPKWMPWHLFWTYFVGVCFIAAAFAMVSGIQRRLAASLVALTFFLFVVLMDIPGWARHPENPFALALAIRQLAFSGGALALAARDDKHAFATAGRWFVAVTVLYYSYEQFIRPHNVPGVPLELMTPSYIPGGAIWTYLAAIVYAVAGVLLLAGIRARAAAASIGLTVLLVEIVVYVPFAVVQRASIEGFNYMADTLMFGGAVLLVAGACQRSSPLPRSGESAGIGSPQM